MRCTALVALFFSFAVLTGCGQKGPLFLPGDPSQVQTSLPGQVSVEETSDDEDDNKQP